MSDNDWLSEQLNGLQEFANKPHTVTANNPVAVSPVQRFHEMSELEEAPLPPVDPMLSVDQMIEQINCYRLLLNDSLFSGTLSPVAIVVQNEIREFIVERIQILLGQKSPKVEAQFSDMEVRLLKDLSTALLKKQGKVTVASSPVLSKTVAVTPKPAPAPLKLNKVEGPKPSFEEVSISEGSFTIPLPAKTAPVQLVPESVASKRGRPKGSKKVLSPKTITDKNTGEVIRPTIEVKGQVRPEGQQPMRMPAANTVQPHTGSLINTNGNGNNY